MKAAAGFEIKFLESDALNNPTERIQETAAFFIRYSQRLTISLWVMYEAFELPVTFKGKDLLLPAQLLNYGYTHKFKVIVYEHDVFFEPDEERAYRAMVDMAYLDKMKNINKELLQVIAEALQGLNSD